MNKPQELPSGSWRIRFTGPDGERYGVTAPTPTKAKSAMKAKMGELYAEQERRAEAKAQARAKAEAKKNKVPVTRFDLFAEQWLYTRRPGESLGYAASSYRKRLNHLALLDKSFGIRDVRDITVSDIRAWWKERSATPVHRRTL
ncbi:hypothetical protein AB0870_09860 [Microbacterium proteolyticum]|uniref:hypothetical protein n=1 Tax=Microbacterium proteolyticum TaxID=1572644 RepID=UPI002416760F|nr:hypothetical protein [Microbacterium proteolyticum]